MKISFALGHELPFPPSRGGGVNSLLESLCRALADDGHAVTAYSPLGEGKPPHETSNGITHVRLKGARRRKNHLLNALCGAPYALALRATLARCDVLSCHMLHAFVFSSAKAARVVTQTLHRDPKFFLGVYRGLDRIYTGSEAVSVQARLAAPVLADKVQTIHNCVDFRGHALPAPNPAPTLRFIFVGRFSEDKGVDVLIRAFVAATRRESRIRLLMVGPTEAKDGGDERLAAKYRAYIEAEGLAAQIEIAPPIFDRTRLDERIRNSDVVCLPSVRGETLNMSIIESMRLAKCLLISDLPANAPLIKIGFNGLFARTGDVADWTEKIIHLAANRDQVMEFGVNSFHYGLETFSAARIARDYVHDFNGLLEKSKR
jgi:glycosyltransferase involved in cell wall biosynthesis